MSLPMQIKIPVLHMSQMANDLTRQIALFPQSPMLMPAGPELFQHHGEGFAPAGDRTVTLLSVAAQIDAQDTAAGVILKEPSDAV